MIEFRGELSPESKSYVQKESSKLAVLSCLIVTIVVGIILIFVGALWEWLVVAFIIVPVFMTIGAAIPKLNAPIKVLDLYLPQKLIIEGETMSIEGKKLFETRLITEVKKVVDMGKCYYIKFNRLPLTPYFIFQKNLIVEGSLEDFEKLFESKIERKINM
ncbi:MAG: hypothetical protein LBQ40_00995 [Clostridiales bacterium]|jgi:hypothetical protein|nr:hypothetical protein [Clostridiales bacterium]